MARNPHRNGDDKIHFTPSEEKILGVLADGMRHTRDEVFASLGDPYSERTIIQAHISRMREKLRTKGQDIICELYLNQLYYRQVRLLLSPHSGRAE